jgi:hypothetical protein
MAVRIGNSALGVTGGPPIAKGAELALQAKQHPRINWGNTPERVAPINVKAPSRIVMRSILYGAHL